MMAKLRKRFYDPEPGETDYSAQMSYEEYVKRIGPRPCKRWHGKGFSTARPQKFKGVFLMFAYDAMMAVRRRMMRAYRRQFLASSVQIRLERYNKLTKQIKKLDDAEKASTERGCEAFHS